MGRLPHRIRRFSLSVWVLLVSGVVGARAADRTAAQFHGQIEPILQDYCYDCHGDGEHKGRVAFDGFSSDSQLFSNTDLWFKALKNVRAGLMPPPDSDADRPSPAEIQKLADWIKYDAFGIDPADPDPGRVTLRRLNRVEYHNTIRDLMGIDYNSEVEFPPDDTGHGFDNLGEVLTVSPLLLEKYLQAAEEVVNQAVPRVSRIPQKRVASASGFRRPNGGSARDLDVRVDGQASHVFSVGKAGTYHLTYDATIRSSFNFDSGRGTLVVSVDGKERRRQEVGWGAKPLHFESEEHWNPGAHRVSFAVLAPPPAPGASPASPAAIAASAPSPNAPRRKREEEKETYVTVRIGSVEVQGPMEKESWVAPENYARFFPDGPPAAPKLREAEARKLLRDFATRAFRRPVDEKKVEQLAGVARSIYSLPGKTFEDGIARAMMAVLASPRFIFLLEEPARDAAGRRFAEVDDYALASRLSYFLWSSMPDAELIRLAGRGELRKALPLQVERMVKDPKSEALVDNFAGQWLQARDIEVVPINARAVLGRNARPSPGGRIEFDGALRKAMHAETNRYFDYVLRGDRSVLEFIDSDYAFVNERLAEQYGIPNVEGDDLRRVTLPPGSPRGGVLTQGTVLAVTSNPTRTSPVKRGIFILENFLGTPPPSPPPNVPALEESKNAADGHELTLREALAAHRHNALCASCHARMDPLGFALENFDALGNWRTQDAHQPIDPSGKLITGERFADIRGLKHVLSHERHVDYYRCLTEKLLTYALGRGLQYTDVYTVDQIVDGLEKKQGRFSALLYGIIESAPFQKERNPDYPAAVSPSPVAMGEKSRQDSALPALLPAAPIAEPIRLLP